MDGLTPKQRALLNYISEYIRRNSYSPSYDEMKDAMGLRSKSGVYRLVRVMVDRGYLTMRSGCSRSIMVKRTDDVIEAIEKVLGSMPLSSSTRSELRDSLEARREMAFDGAV